MCLYVTYKTNPRIRSSKEAHESLVFGSKSMIYIYIYIYIYKLVGIYTDFNSSSIFPLDRPRTLKTNVARVRGNPVHEKSRYDQQYRHAFHRPLLAQFPVHARNIQMHTEAKCLNRNSICDSIQANGCRCSDPRGFIDSKGMVTENDDNVQNTEYDHGVAIAQRVNRIEKTEREANECECATDKWSWKWQKRFQHVHRDDHVHDDRPEEHEHRTDANEPNLRVVT